MGERQSFQLWDRDRKQLNGRKIFLFYGLHKKSNLAELILAAQENIEIDGKKFWRLKINFFS